MRVLVACEFSGVVRRAFVARGWEAVSVDLLPAEDGARDYWQEGLGTHYELDVWDLPYELNLPAFDLMIAHPPCTFLCNSGVRWLDTQPGRRELMEEGARFFKYLLEFPIKHIAVENPVMHKYAVAIVGRRQDQIVQPWQFGHGEVKATGFWLQGLPKLVPTNIVDGRHPRVHRASPGPDRWKERSRTYTGIAEAMADQWGKHAEVCALVRDGIYKEISDSLLAQGVDREGGAATPALHTRT